MRYVEHLLTEDVMTEICRRYTSSENGNDSLLSLYSFIHCCCRIVCVLGRHLFIYVFVMKSCKEKYIMCAQRHMTRDFSCIEGQKRRLSASIYDAVY